MRLASRRLSMGIIAIKEGAQRQPREALSLARRAFSIVQIMRPRQRRTVRASALRINSSHYVDMPAPSSDSSSASSAAKIDLAVGDADGFGVRVSFAGCVASWISRSFSIETRV